MRELSMSAWSIAKVLGAAPLFAGSDVAVHAMVCFKGQWRFLYRAVDKAGQVTNFLFRAKRDETAARCIFQKAMAQNGIPETVTADEWIRRNSTGSSPAILLTQLVSNTIHIAFTHPSRLTAT